MKRLLLPVFLVNISISYAQDSEAILINKHKLSFSESVTIDNWRIEFKALSPDSRCPKEVICVQGGQADVTLYIYHKDVLKKELQIAFFPYSNSDQLTEYLESQGIKIANLKLFPYPKAEHNQVNNNYCMHFDRLIIEEKE